MVCWRGGGGGGSNNCWLLEKASTPKISKLACRQDSETERHREKEKRHHRRLNHLMDKNDETYSRKYPLCDNDDDDNDNGDDDDDC